MKNPAIDPVTGMPSSAAGSDVPTPAKHPNVRSAATLLFVAAAILLVFSEIACRFVLGLGDPPLYQADATMEYMLQPSKTYYRFHNRVSVNRYGMRADDFDRLLVQADRRPDLLPVAPRTESRIGTHERNLARGGQA